MRGEDKITGGDHAAMRLTRGVDYIERNIDAPIALADVAAEAALSDFHFHRLFRARYGVAVMDYVRRRRLAHAADRLVRTRDAIVAVALEAGFESQAAFTRAFRRVFHATPAAYRARGRDVPWLAASALSEETLATLPELRAGAPRLETIAGLRVAGLTATFTGDGRSEIPALWDRLAGLFGPAFQRSARFGISAAPFAAVNGTFEYVAAVAVAEGALAAAGLATHVIPAGTYLVFAFSGAPARLPAAIDYLYGVWLPGSGHVLRDGPAFERYARGFVPGETVELELWFPVQ
jgi:AraC-like DNA-binding protein/predicted transcriptional regulator YdeE